MNPDMVREDSYFDVHLFVHVVDGCRTVARIDVQIAGK